MNHIATTGKEKFNLTPRNFDEAVKFSELIAKSSLVPKDFQNKAGDILIAVQMGAELNLPPMQALQNIAVINGRPSVWGDSVLAIIKTHPDYEYIKEVIIGEGVERKARCTLKRKGEAEHVVEFSFEDAKRAGLSSKPGPWTNYPDRMLQMRARGFCCRDVFPDALKGIITAEEAQDIPPERMPISVTDITSEAESKIDVIKNKLGIPQQQPVEEIQIEAPTAESLLTAISMATTKYELEKIKEASKNLGKEAREKLREPYNKKSEELSKETAA